MTKLIVALDGQNPYDLASRLHDEGLVDWFKIGPQCLITGQFNDLIDLTDVGAKIFLDLKLADTEDTCREAVRRFADAGIAAVSTFTNGATLAAMAGAKDSDLRVWRVATLTDSVMDWGPGYPAILGNGVICPVVDLVRAASFGPGLEKICPGIRRQQDDLHGHKSFGHPRNALAGGATHIVVGRPIWQAADPVAAAKEFLAEIAS